MNCDLFFSKKHLWNKEKGIQETLCFVNDEFNFICMVVAYSNCSPWAACGPTTCVAQYTQLLINIYKNYARKRYLRPLLLFDTFLREDKICPVI